MLCECDGKHDAGLHAGLHAGPGVAGPGWAEPWQRRQQQQPPAVGPRPGHVRPSAPSACRRAPRAPRSASPSVGKIERGAGNAVPVWAGAVGSTGSVKRVRWHPSTDADGSGPGPLPALPAGQDPLGVDEASAAAALWDRPSDSSPGRRVPMPASDSDRVQGVAEDGAGGARDLDDDDEEEDVDDGPPPPPPPPAGSRVRRLGGCLRSFFTHLFSNVGLFTLVGGYVLLGALLFESLEGGYEMTRRGSMKEHRDDCLRELWALTGKRTCACNEGGSTFDLPTKAYLPC